MTDAYTAKLFCKAIKEDLQGVLKAETYSAKIVRDDIEMLEGIIEFIDGYSHSRKGKVRG